jgi:integrase
MASIKKRPDGQWRARYRDEGGKEHSRHFARKVDAQDWLDRVVTSVVTGAYVDPKAGRITFGTFYAQWAERQVWVTSTRRAMDMTFGSVTFGNVPLRSIRPSHVEKWVKVMIGKGLAARTIHTRMKYVRAVFRGAVMDRVIPTDPSVGVSLPRLRRSEAAMTVPTPAQIGKILSATDGPFRAYVGLCAFAGLRLGEASGIQVGDIDFLRRTLKVTRQIQAVLRKEGGFEVRAPKYASEGSIYLAPALASMLSDHIAKYRPGDDSERWLFTGDGGDPPSPSMIDHRWRRARTAAGLESMRLHDCRHFYASGLIAAGCDVVTVQRALRHANATTTLNTYSHLWPSAEDRTRQAAEGMLLEALSAEGNGSPADSVRTGGPS